MANHKSYIFMQLVLQDLFKDLQDTSKQGYNNNGFIVFICATCNKMQLKTYSLYKTINIPQSLSFSVDFREPQICFGHNERDI